MTKQDRIYYLIQYGLENNSKGIRDHALAVIEEEKKKPKNSFNYGRIEKLVEIFDRKTITSSNNGLLYEKKPSKTFEDILIPGNVKKICENLIKEQKRSEELRSYNVEPRNKILLVGEPGNGKTTLAEVVANGLNLPFYTICYENIVSSLLGESSKRLAQMFYSVQNTPCVLFLDEFDSIAKDRGDKDDVGDMKRIVNTLLLKIDSLPSHVVVIAATNHDEMLDRAVWRRFQIKVDLPTPSKDDIKKYLKKFEEKHSFSFGEHTEKIINVLDGFCFGEIEEFCFGVVRKMVLEDSMSIEKIVEELLKETEGNLKNFFLK